MISLSRSLCRCLRVVVRKALGRLKPNLRLIAGPDGLQVQAQGHDQALEYHDPQPRESARLTIPFALLEDVQGTKDEPVHLYCTKNGVLTATWRDRGVERTMQYPPLKDDDTAFPDPPTSWSENPAHLLRALHDAAQCIDPTSSRYALGCLQFQGAAGQLAATDGKQLLLQGGYRFGFPEEILAHGTEVFGCAELPQDQPVEIGCTKTHLVVRTGPWSIFLSRSEGRFPRVAEIIPSFENAQTTVELHPADARFFIENVKRLPGSVESSAVTLDLNGAVAVRSQAEGVQPAEIVLTNSAKTGEDTTICLDRHNLASVAAMGFERVYLYGNDKAVLARDDRRRYVFMPLHEQSAVQRSGDCLVIPSPVSSQSAASCPRSRPFPPTVPMAKNSVRSVPATSSPVETSVESSPQAPLPPQKSAPPPLNRRRRRNAGSGVTAVEQAIALRDQLRLALAGTKDLLRTLKAEKRSQKSLRQALDSLKQLQAVA